MPKPKAVVILGAGASVDFGAPLLKGLFKERYARLQLRLDAFLRDNLNNVFWNPRGHNLESPDHFRAFDARQFASLPDMSPWNIPVASDCIMGVNATGRVTQGGIEKLIAYLQLIKGSFPMNGEGQ